MLRPEFVALDSGHYANHRRLPRNRRHPMPDVSNNAMQKLLAFVNELDRRRIFSCAFINSDLLAR